MCTHAPQTRSHAHALIHLALHARTSAHTPLNTLPHAHPPYIRSPHKCPPCTHLPTHGFAHQLPAHVPCKHAPHAPIPAHSLPLPMALSTHSHHTCSPHAHSHANAPLHMVPHTHSPRTLLRAHVSCHEPCDDRGPLPFSHLRVVLPGSSEPLSFCYSKCCSKEGRAFQHFSQIIRKVFIPTLSVW